VRRQDAMKGPAEMQCKPGAEQPFDLKTRMEEILGVVVRPAQRLFREREDLKGCDKSSSTSRNQPAVASVLMELNTTLILSMRMSMSKFGYKLAIKLHEHVEPIALAQTLNPKPCWT